MNAFAEYYNVIGPSGLKKLGIEVDIQNGKVFDRADKMTFEQLFPNYEKY